jgi:glycine/D-amino acid oxidase-like deaminating enzyme
MRRLSAELIVIGGGYWGAGIAFEGRQRGWTVLVIDDGDGRSGSRAASAICDPHAYRTRIGKKHLPPDWTDQDLTGSFDWLIQRGGYRCREYLWNIRRNTPPHFRGEVILLADPHVLTRLAGPFVRGQVVHAERDGGRWEVVVDPVESAGQRLYLTAKRVAIAAGYRTDDCLDAFGLQPLGVGRLYGRGLNVVGATHAGVPHPISVQLRPYLKHTVRPWRDGTWRIGDSAEENPDDRYVANLHTVGNKVFQHYTVQEVVEGFRPVLDRFLVTDLSPGLVVATGGHRLGLGITGLVAKKATEMLR